MDTCLLCLRACGTRGWVGRLGWDSDQTVCVALSSRPKELKPYLLTHLLMGKCGILGSNGEVEVLKGGPEMGHCGEPTVSYG